ncbi:MAG: zinc ribbon domain-containing protein [Candidatus Lokiarchaeota archaeon]|nr:zinc ribbon domain-containing protein [Candidatus Lokiarchaeota archaeon]
MFCPNCGEKIESPNQNFCTSCGSEFQSTLTPEVSKAYQPITEKPQVPSPVRSVPVYESKSIKVGGPGPHSKRCFAFALIAIAFFIVGLIFGFTIVLRILMPVYLYPYLPGGPVLWSVAFVLHIVGLVFGIISRVNSGNAGRYEPSNALEKVGSVFGVFGIILNALPLVLIPIMITMPIYDPYTYF